LEIHFFRGTNLDSLINDCRIYAAQLNALKQVKIESFVRLLWQMALDLRNPKTYENCWTPDDVADKFELQRRILENKDEHWQASFARYSLMDAFWAGNYYEFLSLARRADFDKDRYAKNSPGTYGITPLTFYIALAALAEAQEATTTWAEARKNFQLGKKFASKIQRWSSKDNPNVKHYETILEAEMAAYKDQHSIAKRKYEAAIQQHSLAKGKYEAAIRMCKSSGSVNDQALTEERFAGFLAKRGQIGEAKIHVLEAVRLYDSWGANSKSSQLKSKYFGCDTRIILPTLICISSN
jgi:tetratricopeptide (TPR) repeat protein